MRVAKENSHYLSMSKRSFKQAVIYLLETEYKIVGSHKVIQMIAEDIEDLARQFYPSPVCPEPLFELPPLPLRKREAMAKGEKIREPVL